MGTILLMHILLLIAHLFPQPHNPREKLRHSPGKSKRTVCVCFFSNAWAAPEATAYFSRAFQRIYLVTIRVSKRSYPVFPFDPHSRGFPGGGQLIALYFRLDHQLQAAQYPKVRYVMFICVWLFAKAIIHRRLLFGS